MHLLSPITCNQHQQPQTLPLFKQTHYAKAYYASSPRQGQQNLREKNWTQYFLSIGSLTGSHENCAYTHNKDDIKVNIQNFETKFGALDTEVRYQKEEQEKINL